MEYELYAKIRIDSKYADQMEKDALFPITLEADDIYCVRGNKNRYRLDDVEIYACTNKLMSEMLQIR